MCVHCCHPLTHPPTTALPLLQHPRAAQLFERDLAPFLSQSAIRFWRDKLRYFSDGLYYHGGMVGGQLGGGGGMWCGGL